MLPIKAISKNPRITQKERNLIKGALRRVFVRSELRRRALKHNEVEHSDDKHPRVKRWSWCTTCGEVIPSYKTQVDHVIPLIPIDKTLEDFTWDELIDRLWCNEENLKLLCIPCHKLKSKLEAKERRKYRK